MKSYLALALICGLASAIPVVHEDNTIDVICPPPTEDGLVVFVSHPYECNKYFVCQPGFGAIGPMSCPGDLQFDSNLNICNFDWTVGCVNTPYPTQSTTMTTPVTTTTPATGPVTTTVPSGKTTHPDPTNKKTYISRRRPYLLQRNRK